jgi:hypothetical protein
MAMTRDFLRIEIRTRPLARHTLELVDTAIFEVDSRADDEILDSTGEPDFTWGCAP